MGYATSASRALVARRAKYTKESCGCVIWLLSRGFRELFTYILTLFCGGPRIGRDAQKHEQDFANMWLWPRLSVHPETHGRLGNIKLPSEPTLASLGLLQLFEQQTSPTCMKTTVLSHAAKGKRLLIETQAGIDHG